MKKKFEFYKKRLIKKCLTTPKNNSLRFICIEYLCSFPGIDPYIMAACIMKEGINILFDDSSTSPKENRWKKNKVMQLL